jgi:hypothetical protein
MWGVEGKCKGVLWGNLKNGHHSQHLGVVWKHDIEIDLQQVGWEGMEWIDLAHVAGLVNAVANPCGSIECGEFLD